MKKVIFTLLLLVLVLGLSACKHGKNEDVSAEGWADIGDIIQLGGFDWIVLHVEGDMVLVMSHYLLDILPYNVDVGDITWEHSTIRAYLNGEFFENTFNEQEKGRIVEKLIANNENPVYGTPGGNDTLDRVFLPSYDEMIAFGGGFDDTLIEKSDNAHPAVLDANRNNYFGAGIDDFFWLRSPGKETDRAINMCLVLGEVRIDGDDADEWVGIRPALWLKEGN